MFNMNFDYLGWIAGVFAFLLGVNQIIHLKRTSSISGVSLLTWQLYAGIQMGWVMHGIKYNNFPMIWASLLCVIMGLSITFYYLMLAKESVFKKIVTFGMIAVFGLMSIGIVLTFSQSIVGMFFMPPSLYGQIRQLYNLYKSRTVKGFSVNALLFYVFNQTVLLFWGVLIYDKTIIVSSLSAMIVLTITMMVFYFKVKKLIIAMPNKK